MIHQIHLPFLRVAAIIPALGSDMGAEGMLNVSFYLTNADKQLDPLNVFLANKQLSAARKNAHVVGRLSLEYNDQTDN